MERGFLVLTLTVLWLLSASASGYALPQKLSKQEEALWLRWLIPLPRQVEIPEKLTLAAPEVGLRLREGASDVEQQAASELAALFREKADTEPDGDGFEILLGVCDQQGKLEGQPVPGAAGLAGLPNSEQAYVIRPVGEGRLALTALDERGVYYAGRTLCQLLENSFADGQVTMPLASVTDWPDISERGEWGGSAARDIEWMSSLKLNLVELHAGLSIDEQGKGVATADQERIEQGRLRALKVVPIIMHLDYLRSSGLHDRWPEVLGVGEAARAPAGGDPVALCFAQRKSTEILTDWMRSLAGYRGVTDINVWLSEYHGQCQCPACKEATGRGLTQHVRETNAVAEALRAVRQDHPALHARVLLTQGTYPDNDKLLAAAPPEVQVSYYCGGGRERSTYNSSRDPMIYPLLEQYAGQGRWLGVYPQFTASYGTVCPWSGPQFIRHLMREFVSKGIDSVCGYTVPNNQLHDFNVTAAAEWSWNVSGRSERDFAIAWATRRGIKDAELVGDWAELLGPVGWRIYGAGPAATPWLSVLRGSANLAAERTAPVLGEGIWRYYQTVEDMADDVEACGRALQMAERLGVPELVHETRVLQAYAIMVREIFAIATTVAEADLLSDPVRLRLQEAMCRLASAGVQGVQALQAWADVISPDLSVPRFDGTLRGTEQTVVAVGNALAQFGIQDPGKPYRRHQIGHWSDEESQERGPVTMTWEVRDFFAQPGPYRVEFDYTTGQNGLPLHRVALASAPQDRPQQLTELSADEHEGFAGHQDRENVYRVTLPELDPGLRYFVVAEVTMPSSTNGLVHIRAAAQPPSAFPVPELKPLTP